MLHNTWAALPPESQVEASNLGKCLSGGSAFQLIQCKSTEGLGVIIKLNKTQHGALW